MNRFPANQAGIFISGGLDSALLYYLLAKENKNIVPLLLVKNPEQQKYANIVISHIQALYQINVEPVEMRSTDIKAAIKEAVFLGFHPVYLGVTKELDEFLVGWEPNNFVDTKWVLGPFKDLDKSQVVSLAVQNNAEHLFLITHSCASQSQGRCTICNRCRERAWAFSQLGLTDPGQL
jgi:7-cyano-7-deazaguanine synthase in queuosine biosynthesis